MPDLLAMRLGLFTLWVYPRIQGRSQADAKPRSVFANYPGAVARVLKRDHKLSEPVQIHFFLGSELSEPDRTCPPNTVHRM